MKEILDFSQMQSSKAKKQFIESQATFDSYFTSESRPGRALGKSKRHLLTEIVQELCGVRNKFGSFILETFFQFLVSDWIQIFFWYSFERSYEKNWCQGNTEMKISYFLRFCKIFKRLIMLDLMQQKYLSE